MSERFPVIPPEQMSAQQRAVASEIAGGPRGGVRGPFVALLHNPELARRVQALGEHLRFGTGLDNVLVEIAVLVTARRWTCQYEWVAHERLARKAGVDPEIIAAIAAGQRPRSLAPDQALVHDFCQVLAAQGGVDEQAFARTRDRFGLATTLDLVGLCGYYTLLAMVLNTADPALPDGTPPPLAPLGG